MQVFMIAAVSVDGFIAQHKDQVSTSWTSDADKKFFREKTNDAVVVMGSATYKTIGRPLPNRLNVVYSKIGIKDAQNHKNLQVTSISPQELIEQLKTQGHQKVAICGGSSIYTQFLQAGVVDKIYLTVEPKTFGSGINLFNNRAEKNLKLINQTRVEDSLFLEYQVV